MAENIGKIIYFVCFFQAPSVSLVLSLLSLHPDEETCGKEIMELCYHLASYLGSGTDGQLNPEIDYPLVIG